MLTVQHYLYFKRYKNDKFIAWPAIDNINSITLVGQTVPIAKGYLSQERQRLPPTEKNTTPIPTEKTTTDNKYFFPTKYDKLQSRYVNY